MVARPEKIPMSVEEYLELDRSSSDIRYEYADGYAYLMSGGTPQHALIIGNFQGELSRQFRQRLNRCRAYPADATVWLSEEIYVHPDVVVTCDEHDLASTDSLRPPRLVVEVLSPSTERRDRNAKFDWYRACGSIQEIVFVRTERPLVEIYRRRPDGQWLLQIYAPGGNVELTSVNLQVPVNTIYEEVSFPENSSDHKLQ
ncbi:MAG TPA: Uma2 family endonuclease [Ktedonobacteraceae bacterium]|nr:Uma2 family endonuclease [Ktedonobacteraceae bacterium]